MSYSHFTEIERGKISAYHESGYSNARIARELGRHRSSIGRELKRNAGKKAYIPASAQTQYKQRREACRPARKLDHLPLWKHVFDQVSDGMTPQHISDCLAIDRPGEPRMQISHEAIYQGIYGDERMHCLIKNLPQARPQRRKRGQGKTRRGPSIPNRRDIAERPPVVDERSRFGDWEGDLIVGSGQSGYILTLVERKSRLLLMRKLESKNAELTAEAIIDAMMDVSPSWIKTITFDNGTEFACHERVARETGADIYFAKPYASYQRGTNENTNGLIRRFLPKMMSFETLTQERLDTIEEELNNRRRRIIEYRTPNEILRQTRTSTACCI